MLLYFTRYAVGMLWDGHYAGRVIRSCGQLSREDLVHQSVLSNALFHTRPTLPGVKNAALWRRWAECDIVPWIAELSASNAITRVCFLRTKGCSSGAEPETLRSSHCSTNVYTGSHNGSSSCSTPKSWSPGATRRTNQLLALKMGRV